MCPTFAALFAAKVGEAASTPVPHSSRALCAKGGVDSPTPSDKPNLPRYPRNSYLANPLSR